MYYPRKKFAAIKKTTIDNPIYFIIGKGAGAGVPDLFGWFQPFAGYGGYKELDMIRNDYVRLHLAIYGVFVRGGIIILIMYIHLLIKLFLNVRAKMALTFLNIVIIQTSVFLLVLIHPIIRFILPTSMICL